MEKLQLLSDSQLADAAACLKIMAHPVRLRIVETLMQGDFSVREISQICGLKENQACEHLRMMQGCGLLTSERVGRSVHYKIVSRQLPSLINCVRTHCKPSEEQHE